jgi:hypothetical protein
MSDGKNLPTLTLSNFSSWKIKIQGYCMQHGLYKYLTNPNPPAKATSLADWEDKRIKVSGILYQCMGETNHQRFIKKDNAKDPHTIWTALVGYYESNSVQNQSVVYQEFLALTYKSSVATFLDKLDACISSIAAVGLKIGTPKDNCDLKESLLAESILAKLPVEFALAKEILYQKRPLTIAMICDSLDNKRREAAAPTPATTPVIKQELALKAKTSSKPVSDKDYPCCAPGWHNPATTGHTEEIMMIFLENKNQTKKRTM